MRGVAERPQHREATEKVPITAFLSIFSVTLFKNYRKRTLKILRSEVFQWPPAPKGARTCSKHPTATSALKLCYVLIIQNFYL